LILIVDDQDQQGTHIQQQNNRGGLKEEKNWKKLNTTGASEVRLASTAQHFNDTIDKQQQKHVATLHPNFAHHL
jgi:hypothetical protein